MISLETPRTRGISLGQKIKYTVSLGGASPRSLQTCYVAATWSCLQSTQPRLPTPPFWFARPPMVGMIELENVTDHFLSTLLSHSYNTCCCTTLTSKWMTDGGSELLAAASQSELGQGSESTRQCCYHSRPITSTVRAEDFHYLLWHQFPCCWG